ncbi:uncharacterized protein Bfra_007646 [Botrytis fragariae]|uniref:Uncharacterized protein n=1 Tax=Botrytis fragariae TaxID=1964551 RepID=A0A8H6AP84_9HELO|nr:uncharacterized protein Bfra_007646 [Botrytis fragariae]KAF5871132.1 hypothetical protein Bfra_007646 [Botrytis fragariae]
MPNPSQNRCFASRRGSLDSNSRDRPTIVPPPRIRSNSLPSPSPIQARPFNLSRNQQNINAIESQRRRFEEFRTQRQNINAIESRRRRFEEFRSQRQRRGSNPDDGEGSGEDESGDQ